MEFEIFDDAIFIADAHANESREGFAKFLNMLKNGEISASQIFFLGDMFDFLTDAKWTKKFYQNEINSINEISQNHEIFYFEGNHDFILEKIFPKAKVFSNQTQPIKFNFHQKSVQIAHGDIFLPIFTTIFIYCMRNKFFIKFMNIIDILMKFKISKSILASQNKKELYREIADFKSLIAQKIHKYNADIVIEGHYHQGKSLNFGEISYFNPKSFAKSSSIYKLKFNENQIFLEEIKIF